MTAVCEVCGRMKQGRDGDTPWREDACEGFMPASSHVQDAACLRARAEKAERDRDEAQEDVRLMQERLARLTSGYKLAAIRAEAAAVRPSA